MAMMLQELLQSPGSAEKTQQFHSYELSFHEVKLALEHKVVKVIKCDNEDELGRAGMGQPFALQIGLLFVNLFAKGRLLVIRWPMLSTA